MTQFDDIRPYTDSEVPAVMRRLLRDQDLRRTAVAFLFPNAATNWGWLLRPLVGLYLRLRFSRVRTVEAFQRCLEGYMKRLVERSTSSFTVSGLDRLDPDKAYLFVSNHRDIVMDPGFMNWALYQHGFQTVRIAIGDNLLSQPFVSDLMRINKSFIVKRSIKGRREKLMEARKLSAYIHHSIVQDNANTWIAQREGRAKDGIDKTNPAVIGMFSLSRPKDKPYADYVRELNIVPVAIAYELDPCDTMKARERYYQLERGGYEKGKDEDVRSIAQGMSGWKGRVHLSFGKPLQEDHFQNDTEVAVAVDRQIHHIYRLFETHETAYRWLYECPEAEAPPWVPKALRERVAQQPTELRPYILAQYANAVRSQQDAD
ncbi:MAG: 1-acyl-sn-glycerol-3-phosphate acyltransferase [Natronospirillum sp.]|uniref:1-acyl-sn-glycerol-3-phosphate acyltransferase n=1 Tax=Natronospirillum sp. TaxID=2812955 RepID=UPI0025F4F54F|nr:1-acyl-sn-glycerol-3-phosphate acyltransferase [Natronospirillum sp.]MCH8553160.1 1-acyl-sn-glycerol-3-phosphate acyltransferase [Natronospirillum sp.]